MTSPYKLSSPKQLLPLTTAVAIFVVAALAFRAHRIAKPSLLVRTAPNATLTAWYNGNWYWVEQRDKAYAVLVRADEAGNERELASADEIGDFAVGSNHLLMDARSGKTWRVVLSDSNGGGARDVWSGDLQPRGAFVSDERAYWLRPKAPVSPAAESFPPFGPQCELMSLSLAGGDSSVISTIMEPQGDEVIGAAAGSVWISTSRPDSHDVTAIYRVPIAGGIAERVAADTGNQSALLTPKGDLYWTAPSREAQNFDQIVCVRRLTASGEAETLTDWMPYGGRLFDSAKGVYYVEGRQSKSAWSVTAHTDLPTRLPLPYGYYAVAMGGNEFLLRRKFDADQLYPLFRMPER